MWRAMLERSVRTRNVGAIVYWTLFGLWMTAVLALLTIGLTTYTGVTAGNTPAMLSEQRLVMHLGMVLLGFPVNFFVPGYLGDLLKPFGVELFSVSHHTALLLATDWAIMALLGWLQWFVALPLAYKLLKRKMRKARLGSSAIRPKPDQLGW
jgi:hypothetical protein